MNEFVTTGIVGQDGRLSMYMKELNDFMAKHKGGKVIAHFTVCGKEASEALKAYYYRGVVPQMRLALCEHGERKSEQQTEYWLRTMSPVCAVEMADIDSGKYSKELKEISEMSSLELINHIEFIKQLAAEEFSTYIEDPKQF